MLHLLQQAGSLLMQADKSSLLHQLVVGDCPRMISILIDHFYFDPNRLNEEGDSPLGLAIVAQNPRMVQHFLTKHLFLFNLDQHIPKFPAIHLAIEYGLGFYDMLCQAGANKVYTVEGVTQTPVFQAMMDKNIVALRVLLADGVPHFKVRIQPEAIDDFYQSLVTKRFGNQFNDQFLHFGQRINGVLEFTYDELAKLINDRKIIALLKKLSPQNPQQNDFKKYQPPRQLEVDTALNQLIPMCSEPNDLVPFFEALENIIIPRLGDLQFLEGLFFKCAIPREDQKISLFRFICTSPLGMDGLFNLILSQPILG